MAQVGYQLELEDTELFCMFSKFPFHEITIAIIECRRVCPQCSILMLHPLYATLPPCCPTPIPMLLHRRLSKIWNKTPSTCNHLIDVCTKYSTQPIPCSHVTVVDASVLVTSSPRVYSVWVLQRSVLLAHIVGFRVLLNWHPPPKLLTWNKMCRVKELWGFAGQVCVIAPTSLTILLQIKNVLFGFLELSISECACAQSVPPSCRLPTFLPLVRECTCNLQGGSTGSSDRECPHFPPQDSLGESTSIPWCPQDLPHFQQLWAIE